MFEIKVLTIIYLFSIVNSSSFELNRNLNLIYEWKHIDFVWSESLESAGRIKHEAIITGRYIPESIIPMDVDVSKGVKGE